MKPSSPLSVRSDGKLLQVGLRTPNNTLTRALIGELAETLRKQAEDDSSSVVIISGEGDRFFSPGFDLRQVSGYDRAQMEEMIEAFECLALALLRHPKPVLAQVNGDCLAGGCILASCCDFRLIQQQARIGMTPINFSIAVPYTAHQVFRHLLGAPQARSALYLGESYPAQRALEVGWVDQVASPRDLASRTEDLAHRLSAVDGLAFATSKAFLLEPLLSQIDPLSPRRRQAFLDCWFSPASQPRLKATLERLNSKTP